MPCAFSINVILAPSSDGCAAIWECRNLATLSKRAPTGNFPDFSDVLASYKDFASLKLVIDTAASSLKDFECLLHDYGEFSVPSKESRASTS